jgi:hypothetical protein
MAASPSLRQSLTLAFSHREKAERLLHQYTQAWDNREIKESDYAVSAAACHAHIRKAVEDIAAIRTRVVSRMDELAIALTENRAAREKLVRRSASGRMSAVAANTKNREILAVDRRLSDEQATCVRLLAAQSAAELDGFVDLPLDRYAKRGRGGGSWERTATLVTGFGFPFVVAFMVFLPWLEPSGLQRRFSLYQAAMEITEIPKSIALPTPAYLWIFFFALPLLSLPFAGMSNNVIAGLGTMTIGICSVAIAPLVLFTPLIFKPDLVATNVFDLRMGAIGYVLGGCALVLHGWQRAMYGASPPKGVNFSHVAAGAVTVWLIAGLVSMTTLGGNQVITISAVPVGNDRQILQVTCCNLGGEPVVVYMPWPDGMNEARRASLPSRSLGVSLQAKESKHTEFRSIPSTVVVWKLETGVSLDAGAITLSSGDCLNATVNLGAIRAVVAELDAVRIVATDAKSETLTEMVVDVPK